MAHKRTFWQDHVTEFSDRYTETNNDDGTISHVPVEGEVIQQGTPQNARNFNTLEEGAFSAEVLGVEAMRVLLLHQRALNGLASETGEFHKNGCPETTHGHDGIHGGSGRSFHYGGGWPCCCF